jgi:general secretion pathway protein M
MSILAKLNPRERIMVLGGGAVLIVLAAWLYVWQPLSVERAAQADRIARYLTIIEITRTVGSRAPVVAQGPITVAPLAPRITQSAEAAGIPLARLDPDGARLRVTVAAAGFAELTQWIAILEATEGVRALSVQMARLTQPGQVSMRLMLEDVQ